ncbi:MULTISPECIES: glycine--tRNA ligase subunit beta [unclassified Sphingomonas]|uniref:glycine--tRNA ligase subunit beta n=1 Tax=unclassified Sphingomonas TaxID=196159 RepID=UPI0006F9EA3C|nr:MULTISPECIES: glycine--tRNA ligase subunit beta [unclassified Sphingomonas]KQM94694.1 glycine--tRNA ligase subunit beta [Sphingomonas sp. Leaf226]MDY0968051.1 glycine--tRNA ligase subunit beta [Sphingomonas sp. CFBP9021]
MTDFLLELRSEEVPARMQAKARDDLARLFSVELAKAGIVTSAIVTYATPRRLTLIARDLPIETAAVSEEVKGPKTSAPPQALEGFLRKTGLTREQLVDRGGTLFAITEKPGRATADVLAEAIPAIVRAFPWPKSMRWGDASASTESLRWVRPLQGIVALLGETIVPFEIAGIASGAATLGHRFHHPYQITIGGAHDYVEKLRACHVIVDQDERATLIRDHAREAAMQAGLELIEDEGLVAENAGLTEWPIPLLGRFDPAFLDVPPEVIQLTARVNQKYFVCRSADGTLANAFVCTANIAAHDGGAKIVEGNRKVLAARLSDAKFFYDTDLKVPLEEQAGKLEKIVFHEKLGTVADKVDRIAKLARWLVEEGIVTSAPLSFRGGAGGGESPQMPKSVSADSPHPNPSPEGEGLADLAERAARLAKADLVTGMVGEFPELQGLMGGYYAAAQGEDPAVAAAIRDHYKPVGQGDDVPTDPVTVAVSLADKLDTLFSFFAVKLFPTGSKDPFALRRAALGVLRTIQTANLKFKIDAAARAWSGEENAALGIILSDFLHDRLGVQLREAGIRYDYVQASTGWGTGSDDRIDRVEARAKALANFISTEDGKNLLAGYKRAANILKKEAPSTPPLRAGERDQYAPEPAEAALQSALDSSEPRATAAIAAEDFAAAMAALASLRAPIDAFFDSVIVNDADPAKRSARLALLERIRAAVHNVADFSKIEG